MMDGNTHNDCQTCGQCKGKPWFSLTALRDRLAQLTKGINPIRTTQVMDCDPKEFTHQPDEYQAGYLKDGVLHTFTGPNNDGHTRTWQVATRHPEGTTNG